MTNAICHRNYASTRDTEVRIFDREVMIWNDGDLPRELSVQALKKKHPSVPRNKQIAEIFYYAGMIEAWGSGTRMMLDECKAAGMPAPTFEQVQGFRVTFKKALQAPPMIGSTADRVLAFCKTPRSRDEIAEGSGLSSDCVRKEVLPALIRSGKLAQPIPAKPRSKQQRYVGLRGSRRK